MKLKTKNPIKKRKMKTKLKKKRKMMKVGVRKIKKKVERTKFVNLEIDDLTNENIFIGKRTLFLKT